MDLIRNQDCLQAFPLAGYLENIDKIRIFSITSFKCVQALSIKLEDDRALISQSWHHVE